MAMVVQRAYYERGVTVDLSFGCFVSGCRLAFGCLLVTRFGQLFGL